MNYNVLDLFCGAGGLSYGFELAGFNVILGIDNDAPALKTFKMNHKNSEVLEGDITNISYQNIKEIVGEKRIDVIVGGPPCQGMSLSGPRNLDDSRNRLYLSFIRLVSEIRPKAFVVENVPGLVSLYRGQIRDRIIEEFNKLGYTICYRIMLASDYGVPQNRRRVVFVGSLEGEFEFPKHNENRVTCEEALSDLPPLVGQAGDAEQNYYKEPQNEYQKIMRKKSFAVKNHIAAKHSENVIKTISLIPPGKNYKALPDDFVNTRKFNVAWTRFPDNSPAPTIDTGHRHHFHYKYNRVPTVRECARIQSFPDCFEFYGNKTQQFRQVGNAVPPLMAKKIAEQVKVLLRTREDKNDEV